MQSATLSRRDLLGIGITGFGLAGLSRITRAADSEFPPVRVIIRGPKFHWFGNYGKFAAPQPYRGEFRCDTHPRHSRDGKLVVIDAPESGSGRQLHLLDISSIVALKPS
jgi:hypothetical protein